jgi:hypothetical protein
MDVALGADGNPSYTQYALRCSATSPADANWDGMYLDAAGNPSASIVYQTQTVWGTTTTVGMAELTTYTFEVNAINEDGRVTAAGTGASLATTSCGTYGDGDFDVDGDVDFADFVAFMRCFDEAVGPGCEPGNMAGDDTIDLTDYEAFEAALAGP